MNPKFQASVNARDDVSYVKIGGIIDEDNELGALADRIGAGTAIIDLSDVERINSCGVRDWVNWLGKAEKGGAHVVLVQCSPAIVAQINLVNNFSGNGVVKNFFAPYFCPNCDREKVLLVETRDVHDKKPVRAPTCRCDECDGPMDFDDMEESYFAFLANGKKVVIDASYDQTVAEFVQQDERKLRAKTSSGTNPAMKIPSNSHHTGGTMSSTPVSGKGGSSDRLSTVSGLNSFGGGSSGGKAAVALAELEARRNQTNSIPLEPSKNMTALWVVLALFALIGTGYLGYYLFIAH